MRVLAKPSFGPPPPLNRASEEQDTQPFHVLRNGSELTVWRIAGMRLRNIELSYHSGEIG